MNKTIAVCTVLALLSACGSHYTVTKDGVSDAQKKVDANACWYDAQKSVAGAGATNVLIAKSEAKSLTLQCMQNKGYTVIKN